MHHLLIVTRRTDQPVVLYYGLEAQQLIGSANDNPLLQSKSINLMTIQTAINEIEEFELGRDQSWTTYTVASNHYSAITFTGKANPLQSLQECIEGKAAYAIPGYP